MDRRITLREGKIVELRPPQPKPARCAAAHRRGRRRQTTRDAEGGDRAGGVSTRTGTEARTHGLGFLSF